MTAAHDTTRSRRHRVGRAAAGLAAGLALGLTVAGNPAGADILLNCGGGGHTLGFWSNKNGAAVMNDDGGQAAELTMLAGLNLVDANGAAFDPASYSSFRTWLLSANATNMSYMLSAQLAAMALNVEAGFVNGAAEVYVDGGTTTIDDLMTDANAALGSDGNTPAGDVKRAAQEALKNALDAANNNLNFVSIGTDCEPPLA